MKRAARTRPDTNPDIRRPSVGSQDGRDYWQDARSSVSAPGPNPGMPGLSWASYLDDLVAQTGSLAAVAAKLASERGFVEDVSTVERGLRRLREREQRDGGVWGRRLLATFGLPAEVDDRVRWMGQYHTRFSDLPTSLCHELLLPWDRPPVSESPARVWVQLGLASVALRRQDPQIARAHLLQVERLGSGVPDAAFVEHQLVVAFLVTRSDPPQHDACLDAAEARLRASTIDPPTAACLWARLVDQRAYHLNKPRHGPADHVGALAMYESIPADGPAFSRCRRHNGMGWSLLRLQRTAQAREHARASVREAGDAGSLRLRAMALNLLAAVLSGPEAAAAGRRAAAIAERLQDDALVARYLRHSS